MALLSDLANIFSPDERSDPSSWKDRLREASYISPSGTKIVFTYENVSRSRSKNTVENNFPDVQGSLIQDLGSSGRRFPIRAIFWGNNCDLEADQFEAMLFETGIGKLSHPLYGLFDVVPFGSITRKDDLKSKANQSMVEVEFYETLLATYPVTAGDPIAELTAATNALNEALAADLAKNLDTSSEGLLANIKNTYNSALDSVESALRVVADAEAAVQKQFNEIEKSINRGIDVLIRDPLNLCFQTQLLIQSPARAAASISARLDSYKNLANDIFNKNEGEIYEPGFTSKESNDFYTNDMVAQGAVSGSVVSIQNNNFETKTEAIESANDISELFDELIKWRDANLESLDAIDTGESYQALQKLVSLSIGYLVALSFSLKTEKVVTLSRDRTMIDLCAELYGDVDSSLDFFINTNGLSGSQMIELKKGDTIVYYS